MIKIKVMPSEQRIVILPDEKPEERKTAGGIIIPDSAEEEAKPEFSTVVSTGTGSENHPMKYYVGDRILSSEYAGTEIKLNLTGEMKTYKVMNQLDVMGKIEEV